MKVLVATDGSEHSMKAVARALELADKQGALVTLMSVSYYDRGDLDEMPPSCRINWRPRPRPLYRKRRQFSTPKAGRWRRVVTGLVPANLIIGKAQEGTLTASSWAPPA